MPRKTLWLFLFILSACSEKPLDAPPPPAWVRDVPSDWAAEQKARRQAKAEHIKEFSESYDRFSDFAVSETDGVPYLFLKLLPELAPEFWGDKSNFLSVIGLYIDDRRPNYPLARGIGITAFTRKDLYGDIDYASFTCGGCHIGRVRLDDGSYDYLDGGVNTQHNTVLFRRKVIQTLNKIYAGETDKEQQKQLVITAVRKALDKVQQRDKHYFYKNYAYKDRKFDADYEAKQIALFRERINTAVPVFVDKIEQVYSGWEVLTDKLYSGIKQDVMIGFGGMEDALSFNAVNAYNNLKSKWYTRLFARLPLPSEPGMTDIMAVWEQDKRNPVWNQEQDDLINGGGQWNGHIPLLIYKNIAAQQTLGFDNIDIRVSDHSDRLLDKLPASVYPFDVDLALARKGQKLFAEHCAACHQPNNGKVYRDIGTHMGRARIANRLITFGAQGSFTDACGPDTVTVDIDGQHSKPCAKYKGVSLLDKKKFTMASSDRHDGYNALPLIGIWAQAPYLHNGSVPTIYQLLVPGERPAAFIKGRLDYDKQWLGFSWDPKVASRGDKDEGYLYKPASDPAIGHAGHDKDIRLGDKTFKLDWTHDKEGAMAIIEYMKTI
ncbi:MAG: cytochrome c [Gammaproteobacteria bacterium]|nr:cytochrome c [Gammaproteobacteria bacterium]MDH5653536.1 cytochrome c [Gammaproteobacteria bacterium]